MNGSRVTDTAKPGAPEPDSRPSTDRAPAANDPNEPDTAAETRGARGPDAATADAGAVAEARGAGKPGAAAGGRAAGKSDAATSDVGAAGALGAVAEATGPGKSDATPADVGVAGKSGAAAGGRVAGRSGSGRESGVVGEVRGPEGQAEIAVRDAISAPDAEGRPRRVTKRFPLFTRDTARPEGGGRAAPRDAPAPARQWPILAVLSTVGLGLLLTALDQFRVGTLLIGVALLAGAVLRWLLPDVGMLAVRSRFTDIATYGVLGTVIVLLAMMVQPNPWLVIPFLKDTLHFTVSSS